MSTTEAATTATTNGLFSSSNASPALISPRSSSGPNNAPAIPEQPPMPFEGSHAFYASAGEVPASPLVPCRESTQPLASLGGPHYRLPTTIRSEDGETIARAQSFSSFPKIRPEKRVTDPIADRFVCMSFYDRTIVAIADGCGRGANGAIAAERAVTTFVSYLSAVHFRVSNLNHLAHWLHRALYAASDAVFPPNVRAPRRTNIVTDTSFLNNTTSSSTFNAESDGPRSRTLDVNYVFEDEEERSLASIDDREFTSKQVAVSVSLLGGILLRLAPIGSGSSSSSSSSPSPSAFSSHSSSQSSSPTADDDWVFICISVGDCNAYHLFKDDGAWNVFDIGAGGRTELESLTDPGGRLGPIIEGAQPDLRNLTISVRRCKPSDLLLFTTPGVHDNMHPMYLGRSPRDLGIGNDWRELSDLPKAVTKVHSALTEQLKNVVLERRLGDPTVDSAVDDVSRYTMEATKKRREYLEELVQAGAELVDHDDYAALPGRLNHATIMALKVSLLPLSGLKKTLEEVDVSQVAASQAAASSPQGAKSKRLQGGGRGRGRGGRGGGSPRAADSSPPTPASYVPSPLAASPSVDITPDLRTLSVPTTELWIWKAIIPSTDPPTFDIWSKFTELNSPLSKVMSMATEITFTNFYLNIFDPTIELRISGSRNLVEVSLRTDKDEDCEFWEKVGQIPLSRTMRKPDILAHLRKLLSDGVMDMRRARAVLSKLDSFRPDIDTIAVAGSKRRLRCSSLGSTFRIITGDLVIGQADVEMIGGKGETIGKFRVVDLQGSKPDYISKFVRQVIEPSITDDWELMNISELLSRKQQPPV